MAKQPNGMSVLDRIKELDAERARLLDEAKATALANAEQAVAELNELGFDYRLVQGSTPSAPRPIRATPAGRRSGIRESVLEAIQNAGPDGIAPSGIRQKLGIADDDKSGAQSVSNALSALKKASKISDKNGAYVAA